MVPPELLLLPTATATPIAAAAATPTASAPAVIPPAAAPPAAPAPAAAPLPLAPLLPAPLAPELPAAWAKTGECISANVATAVTATCLIFMGIPYGMISRPCVEFNRSIRAWQNTRPRIRPRTGPSARLMAQLQHQRLVLPVRPAPARRRRGGGDCTVPVAFLLRAPRHATGACDPYRKSPKKKPRLQSGNEAVLFGRREWTRTIDPHHVKVVL